MKLRVASCGPVVDCLHKGQRDACAALRAEALVSMKGEVAVVPASWACLACNSAGLRCCLVEPSFVEGCRRAVGHLGVDSLVAFALPSM